MIAIEIWPIGRLKPYPRNARVISEAAIAKVALSIEQFGWRQPVVVDNADVIIAGHVRWLAAMKLGLQEVPVHVADGLTPAQVRAYRLMDNRSHQQSSWNFDLLGPELLDLQNLGFGNLELTGFDPAEIDEFIAGASATVNSGLTDEDDVPELEETPISAPGDLWIVGDHRVLCGDATKGADVDRLTAGQAVDLIFTDPPYNVSYEGYTEDRLTIKGDRMTAEQFRQFLCDTFASYRRIAKPGASMYVCHSSSWQREFQNAIESAGFEVRCQIIWAKNTFAWGFGRYKFQHEPIFYAHLAGQKDPWYGDKAQSTLWQERKPAANRIHPTAKPVELIDRALVNSSKTGDIVADHFGGSGSTLIGCERRGRKARLMEIDPKYVDCIVRRWQEFTGKPAILDGDGRTFDEVVRERQQIAA
jgi:DNA modification methylase